MEFFLNPYMDNPPPPIMKSPDSRLYRDKFF